MDDAGEDRLTLAYLRALDMRDEVAEAAADERMDRGGQAWRLRYAIKKFDAGGDEPTHDPNAEWGGGHTR